MCLSELQARLNVGQPLFPTHALCIRRSQQHRSPPAGIDFRGAFRILNISELHQRNWYLAQYIPAGKTANISFLAFRTTRPSLDTPDTEKGPPHG